MEKRDFLLVHTTGKEKETGRVFQTTVAEDAEKAGAFDPSKEYEAEPVILGEGQVVKGVEEALLGMKEGEEKTIELEPEKAFGERNPGLVSMAALHDFHKREINPFPGLLVDVNGKVGRVQSVSGGRVRIDFNHELAGKTVEYKVKLVRKVSDKKEQMALWAKKMLPSKETRAEYDEGERKLSISLPTLGEGEIGVVKRIVEQEMRKVFPEIKKLEFEEKEKGNQEKNKAEAGKETEKNG